MRYQTYAEPRIRSTSTSSGASSAAAWGCCSFQRSSPASAAALSDDCAITMSGIVDCRRPFFATGAAAGSTSSPSAFVTFFFTAFFTAEVRDFGGCTRAGSPSILRKCGGQGASSMPSASSRAAISSNASSTPACSFIAACGSPIFAKRSGIVNTVKSAGSHVITSSQRSGVLTRASGSGLTE
jgi:hypothetical protein